MKINEQVQMYIKQAMWLKWNLKRMALSRIDPYQ
jgi:hypothetical protein